MNQLMRSTVIGGTLLFALAACAPEAKPVDQVQTNLVDKAIFEGEWWHSSTTIDVDYDSSQIFGSAQAFAPFEGSMSTDYGLDFNRSGPYVIGAPYYSFPIARIVWTIDEDFLVAYRAFELVQGGNDDARSPDFRGQPLAVFAIEDHVDVRQDYNPVTGENSNVRVENTSDRLWHDRKFMRVDWSQNLITAFAANDAEANDLFQTFERESVPMFVQEGGGEFPEAYRPQFVRVQDDEDYRFAGEWPDEERDKVHYMSFVTKEAWSPGGGCFQTGGTCASAEVTMRNAFLRVPPEHEYAVSTMTHREFDKFGIFRSHQPSYARGGQDKGELHDFCTEDAHCGQGGACDVARNVCVGGLTADRGETDFLSFFMSRQNLYQKSFRKEECVADWECDARYLTCDGLEDDAEREECAQGLVASHGSTCDPAARRCTIPLRDREIQKVVYRLGPHYPPYLVREAFAAVAEWNEALMRGRRASEGRLPIDQIECSDEEEADPGIEGPEQRKGDGICTADLGRDARVECQTDNPAGFCYCGSPEEQRGFCQRAYLPFESPADARKRGVPNPYDCYVVGPADVAQPEDYEDYAPSEAYDYRFEGDECVLTLLPNSCDVDEDAPCEELGDLRHHFMTHVQHGGVQFGGVAQPLSDPTTGELVVSNATIAAESIESVATIASQMFPVLRGETPEDEYFTGEHLRGYYARLGLVEHPVSIAPSGSDGYTTPDNSRPPSSQVDLFADLESRMQALEPKMSKLQGQEGRVAILEDRVRQLRGTDLAARIDAAIQSDTQAAAAESRASESSAPPASLVEQSPLDEVLRERQRRQIMAGRNMDDFEAKLYNSQYWQYWADRFAGRSLSEASLRIQQLYARSVMIHEIGHALGLRHNFGGSLDRDNYHDAYFPIAREHPLPAMLAYDNAALGGDGNQQVTGLEAERWANDLRAAREERLAIGAGNVMTSSVMDYDGDLSSFAGMGRYDAAAVMFSYFDTVEAYDSGDPTVSPGEPPSDISAALSLEGLAHADSYRRELWRYYRGGETCRSNADCPHAAGRETTAFQVVAQRCVSNPRAPNTTGDCADGGCICSNYHDDFADYLAGRAYRSTTRAPEFTPVDYLYCHDNRINDLSWCTAFDAGESFQESIDHYRLGWLQRYPQVYFRNFRRSGPSRGYSQETVVDAVKIYQHLFFRYNYEGAAFRGSRGPLGFNDQLLASADVLNWLAEIIGAPDVGSYELDEDSGVYRPISSEPDAPGADLSLPPGQGFYMWSAYQEGHQGFFRLERAGTFLDKLLAIEALARRDWGLSYTIDERYYINFYDLFDREVIDLFGGLILRDPAAYAPRVGTNADGESTVRYLSLYRDVDRASNAAIYPEPAIDGSDSEVLRDAAAIEALATFPVFYDTSFEQRLLVFKNGSGEGYELPATRPDGTPTCAYGATGCDAPDYIVYDSDRLHTSYVAVVIQPNREQGIDEQQLGYQLLLKLTQNQQRIRELQALPTLTEDESAELERRRLDLERDESFVEYLIELARNFGISTYLF
jgi:hypothetical protein